MSQSVAPAEVGLSSVERVHPSARVRHFDQLSEPAKAYVSAWAADERVPARQPAGLQSGDVVVFTDYLLVE